MIVSFLVIRTIALSALRLAGKFVSDFVLLLIIRTEKNLYRVVKVLLFILKTGILPLIVYMYDIHHAIRLFRKQATASRLIRLHWYLPFFLSWNCSNRCFCIFKLFHKHLGSIRSITKMHRANLHCLLVLNEALRPLFKILILYRGVIECCSYELYELG